MSSEGLQPSLEEIPDNVLSENIDDTAAPISLGSQSSSEEDDEDLEEEEAAAPEEDDEALEEEEAAADGTDGSNMPCKGFTTIIKRRNDEPNTQMCDYYIVPPENLVKKYPALKAVLSNGKELRSQPDAERFNKKLQEIGPDAYKEFLDKECIEKLKKIKFKSRIDNLTEKERKILTYTELKRDKKSEEEEKEKIESLIVSDDEEESDNDEDEEFFQKLENEINTNELLDYHPEIMQNNYQEVKALCKVTRDKRGNIIDPLHKTIPFLTKYEKARVLGVRCKQISNGADPFIEVPPNMINGMLIAEKELHEKVLPFIIRRPLPNGGSEYWHMSDLELIEY